MIETRWATQSEIERALGPQKHTLRARIAVDGDRVLGIAGYYLKGGVAYVFSESFAPLPKMLIWRESVRIMQRIGRLRAACVADPCIETAPKFLARLGWRHVATTDEGELYAWQA